MTIEDETRKAATQARQRAEQIEDAMRQRAEVAIATEQAGSVAPETRQLAAKQRQHQQHQQDTLLSRAEESIRDNPNPDQG